MATPKNAATFDLAKAKIEVLGLPAEYAAELKLLGIVSVAQLVAKMTACNGDFTTLSTSTVLIDEAESNTIGDTLLAYEHCPKALKDAFEPSKKIETKKDDGKKDDGDKAPTGEKSAVRKLWDKLVN